MDTGGMRRCSGRGCPILCTVCPGDVASSGLLLDYGEVTSHAGKEWMEVKYAVGRRYWLILLAC